MNGTLLRESTTCPMTAQKTDQVRSSEVSHMPRSFDEQFLTYWAPVYRLLVRLVGDPAEAEDLALETFLRLHQKPPSTGEGSNLGGWLRRVATNLGLHSIRSYRRREEYELTAGKNALDEAFGSQPAEILAEAEEHQAARCVLAQMQERQARILILRYSGMAYKEIADELGVAPSSIGPLLLRAEREFEKQYRFLNGEKP